MNAVAKPVDPQPRELHEIAGEWLVRRHDARWSALDEAQLQRWLAADVAHRQAFERLARTWVDMAEVPRPALAWERPGALRANPDRPASGFGGWWLPRRALVPAAMALGALLVFGGWHRWDNTPAYALSVATGPSERRSLDLPDGSRIDLNSGSELALRYYPRRREAVLQRGEAFFEVASDAAKPFTVDSGASRVTVVGTRFNVRAAPPQLVIKVLEGRVHVLPDRAHPGQLVALAAAQGLDLDAAEGVWRARPAPPDSVGDWRSGRLVFRRTPMAEVAQEVARYLGHPVVVQGGAVLQALPVSGFADIQAPGAFLEALPGLLPVQVHRRAGGGYLVVER